MIQSVADHFDYLSTADPGFRQAWSQMGRSFRGMYRGTLREIESGYTMRPACQDGSRTHSSAVRLLADRFSGIPDRDFPTPPPPDLWIRFARDRARLERLRLSAGRQLTRVIRRSGAGSRVLCYGGVKSPDATERKIRDYQTGKRELDLWDLVRFRIVADNTRTVRELSMAIWKLFGARVVRCRNYYTMPRKGRGDPYRAIHFELKMRHQEELGFVEVQILTRARESVGLIDHNIIHKRTVRYGGTRHEQWLRRLSCAANVFDAGGLR